MTVQKSKMALLAGAMLAFLALETHLHAQHGVLPHWNYRRVSSQYGLRSYDYEHDRQRFRDSALAIADPVIVEEWLEQYGSDAIHPQHAQRGAGIPSARMVPDRDKPGLVRYVARKPFHFTTASLLADNVNLQQVGLSIYETGTIAATGRISHDGGPDGSLAGAHIELIIRAYSSIPQTIVSYELPLNSPMIWQSTHRLWVSRNQPQVISLVDDSNSYAREIRQNFHQITHLEVELVAARSR